MGWLDRDPKTTKESARASEPTSVKTTIIGEGLEIRGEFTAKEDVWIAGQVIGKIASERRVVVAAGGRVSSSVSCRDLVIHGEVKGDVKAEQEVIIEATGRLLGELLTPRLIVRPGGFFEGHSRMLDAQKEDSANIAEFQKKKTARG